MRHGDLRRLLDELCCASAEFTLRLCVGSDERLDAGEVVGHSLSIRRIVLGSPFIERGDHFDEGECQRAELLATMFFLNLENFIIQNEKTPFVEGVEEVVQAATKHHVQAILSSPQLRDWWERDKLVFSLSFVKL